MNTTKEFEVRDRVIYDRPSWDPKWMDGPRRGMIVGKEYRHQSPNVPQSQEDRAVYTILWDDSTVPDGSWSGRRLQDEPSFVPTIQNADELPPPSQHEQCESTSLVDGMPMRCMDIKGHEGQHGHMHWTW